jgi:hypothetical protein
VIGIGFGPHWNPGGLRQRVVSSEEKQCVATGAV